MNRDRGLTLVEILVAIIIVTVIAALMLNTYTKTQKRPFDAAAQACGRAIVQAAIAYRGMNGSLPATPFHPNVLGGDVQELCNSQFRIAGYYPPSTKEIDKYAIESTNGNDVAFFINSPKGTGFWTYHTGDGFCGPSGCTLNRLIPFEAYF